ncbi:MAG: hypothetical protein A3A96_02945 [Candidatus Zambryskibacteria bacterium RIFCSPLOWO2_01_FULL_39_39]|uniref:Steroid 5-alpha reductase C-terminal domain-containing protein n=1 Tax=Candidatus Zambryskibacteria bacterium RIFCSPLOWO2_01_FULL_39_39 TaxID=1802758 RepID=A0A1G2TYA0_9BACT|nr:MAG: S-isoprenylcysteine methyltransferase-like protein [Parcubacteria group bacterium GW2011_GWA1_38_7]OHA86880.1 MAG: hypothetical protein A2644_00155 [Candidatus Zambryskibacteria bacterium RIFCSPHIGHO2_01_FULL_39_63]OHA94446.1 MAG: hypothetical protein A3B88_01975 [Candidatus Zambryskibacteria bacterium RIFCSPHIGHO2_02_FULL_39_19]OHA98977.1 MAG: hypothetical protein A3F20_00300 [Candidatus Zambryskibacteria bacterium RIFCSPHIGHO2_12_FULL_39_21]OHB01600.1 MAG: hypothetical protein A3A96_0
MNTEEKLYTRFLKKYKLKYLVPSILTIFSIYFWITLINYDFLKIIGLIINIVGLLVWWFARLTLAENWDAGYGKPTIKQLVTRGIYSKIRHPLYLGINMTLAGLSILYSQIWFAGISLVIIIYFFRRMYLEDSYLSEKLGEEYRDYKNKTWF